jgi:hypothetical protein
VISWMLGYPDRSLEELRAAVASAEALGHPFTLAQTLCFVGLVHIFRHEPSAAHTSAQPVHASSKMSYTQSTFV